ncbi:hypothetical protein THAOC_17727, partial [Thalassiosira oceanica]
MTPSQEFRSLHYPVPATFRCAHNALIGKYVVGGCMNESTGRTDARRQTPSTRAAGDESAVSIIVASHRSLASNSGESQKLAKAEVLSFASFRLPSRSVKADSLCIVTMAAFLGRAEEKPLVTQLPAQFASERKHGMVHVCCHNLPLANSLEESSANEESGVVDTTSPREEIAVSERSGDVRPVIDVGETEEIRPTKGIPHLEEVRGALRDRGATVKHREKLAADLKKYDIPLIIKAAELITTAATATCPLAGMKEHFRKKFGDEKDAISQTRLSKDITPVQYMVSRFINNEEIETPRKPPPPRSAKIVSPPSSSADESSNGFDRDLGYDPADTYDDISLPLPENGREYTKVEAANIQASALEESKTKARLDELELFTPCAFFSYTLALCPFVCLFVCLCFAPQKSGPPNKTLPFYLQRTFKLLAAASGSGLTAKQG